MKKILGVVVIVAGLAFAYWAFTSDSRKAVKGGLGGLALAVWGGSLLMAKDENAPS